MTNERLKLIKEMLETNPDDSFLKYAAALEYEKDGDRKQAIVTIRDLLANDANYLGAYYKLGKLLEEVGKEKEAIKIYRQGLEVSKKISDLKTEGELTEALMLLGADDDITWA
ncbi:MAG: tetratricopeptide repeat protein [Cryomorphaceae bacterium]